MKVGFIGTGTMGQPMLANLVKKGFQAIAYDTAAAASAAEPARSAPSLTAASNAAVAVS